MIWYSSYVMFIITVNLLFKVQGSGFRVQGSGFRVRDSGFRVSPWGVLPFDYVRKRFSGFYGFKRFKGGGAAHKK